MDKLEVKRISPDEVQITNGEDVYSVRSAASGRLRIRTQSIVQIISIIPSSVSTIFVKAEDVDL